MKNLSSHKHIGTTLPSGAERSVVIRQQTFYYILHIQLLVYVHLIIPVTTSNHHLKKLKEIKCHII